MDITYISQTCIKLRGKKASAIIDPIALKGKVAADVSILLDPASFLQMSSVEESKLTVSGPGEYEVGGMKITGISVVDKTMYVITLDGLKIVVAKASSITKTKDIAEPDMLVIYADTIMDNALLGSLSPRMLFYYGEKAEESSNAVGKTVTKSSKANITKEKLPAEMEVVLLTPSV